MDKVIQQQHMPFDAMFIDDCVRPDKVTKAHGPERKGRNGKLRKW